MGVSKTRPFVLGTITHALHSVDLSRLGDQAMHQSDVTVTCRWCENSQRVSERKAGTTVKCSKCGNSIAVDFPHFEHLTVVPALRSLTRWLFSHQRHVTVTSLWCIA